MEKINQTEFNKERVIELIKTNNKFKNYKSEFTLEEALAIVIIPNNINIKIAKASLTHLLFHFKDKSTEKNYSFADENFGLYLSIFFKNNSFFVSLDDQLAGIIYNLDLKCFIDLLFEADSIFIKKDQEILKLEAAILQVI